MIIVYDSRTFNLFKFYCSNNSLLLGINLQSDCILNSYLVLCLFSYLVLSSIIIDILVLYSEKLRLLHAETNTFYASNTSKITLLTSPSNSVIYL